MDRLTGEYWDRWWQAGLSGASAEAYPMLPTPIHWYRGVPVDPVNSDDLLIAVMAEYGMRTILCAGNGESQEPPELRDAGFHVNRLDISSIAVSFAEAYPYAARGRFCSSETRRPGGSVEFVVGDLLDTRVCPGPFDVVIERRTVQVFYEQQRAAALSALSQRLSSIGI